MKKTSFFLVILTVLLTLGSCGSSEIIDLIHKDTDDFYLEELDITSPRVEKYQIEDVLFIPYIISTSSDKFYIYSLKLASYMEKKNNKEVIINNVSVKGTKNVVFTEIIKTINKNLDFQNFINNNDIQSSDIVLIDKINGTNMELNEQSELKIILNISVKEGSNITTRDLEYTFQTVKRKYLQQR